jgi:hypothetical protein
VAIDALIEPPAYSAEGLLRSLEDPLFEGYETRISRSMEEHGLDREAMPLWQRGRVLALPDSRLVRALTSTGATSEAELTAASLAEVAQAVRPATVLEQLGVPRREIGGAATVEFPIVDAFTAGGWQGELVAGAEVAPTFKSASASPKEARAFIQYSRRIRLLAAGGDGEKDILTMLSEAAEATLEAGFLKGAGNQNQPAGLFVQAKGARTFAGATPTRAELVNMVTDFTAEQGRLDRAAWVMTSAMAVALMNTEAPATSGRFLLEVDANGIPRVLGLRVGISNHSLAGKILLFDPQHVRLIFWGPAYAMADKYGALGLSGGTKLILSNICDVVALQPAQMIVGGAA